MRYGTNKEKNTKLEGGVETTGKGEPWHTKEEYANINHVAGKKNTISIKLNG